MEIQWPLIIFSTFISWSAGLFATQGVYALMDKGKKAQMPALITAVVVMAIGGIAVVFHLQHWERIFNGFGHITSGITQELIGIVIMFIIMVVFFVALRRSGKAVHVPKPVAILAILSAALLIYVMGHSYVMAARPAWDSVLQILSLFGAAFICGPATMAIIVVARKEEPQPHLCLIGACVNAVTSIAYLLSMDAAASAYRDYGYYYDPTLITRGMVDVASATSVFGENRMMIGVFIIVFAILAILVCLLRRKNKQTDNQGAIKYAVPVTVLVCGLVSAALLRVMMYAMGLAVVMLY